MSVLIKGMEMPMSGDVLDILVFPNGEVQKRCSVNAFHLVRKASAIPVPTPHGRLIDADALTAAQQLSVIVVGERPYIDAKEVVQLIYGMPTIIEAEEGME